ncbi:MAG: Asp23/Gls24 family envelope stress response protein [Eubacteriales bacterium]
MKTFGLVGKSGTGKSYQAMNVCKEKDIDYIIDDGLLISKGIMLEGLSAKRQDTKVGAIKVALFTDEEQKDLILKKLEEVKPESILILGTSVGMIRRIAHRLQLPDFSEIIKIEEITTEKEIETAIKQRNDFGKHVIPVPTVQLKKHFSGYFLDPLNIFRGWGGMLTFTEKSIVRPSYSYLGKYIIFDNVIGDIVNCIVDDSDGISSAKTIVRKEETGIIVIVQTTFEFGISIINLAKEFQKNIYTMVENMTAFNIISVNIEVKGLK